MHLTHSIDKGIRFVDISYPCRKIDHHSDFSSNSEESEQKITTSIQYSIQEAVIVQNITSNQSFGEKKYSS